MNQDKELKRLKESLANRFMITLFGDVNAVYEKDIEMVDKLVRDTLSIFSTALTKAKEEGRQEMLKDISTYNVAFCNKCKGIFKAKHENCRLNSTNTKK